MDQLSIFKSINFFLYKHPPAELNIKYSFEFYSYTDDAQLYKSMEQPNYKKPTSLELKVFQKYLLNRHVII